jgi:hypothetical protein
MAGTTENDVLNWKIWLAMPAIKTRMDDLKNSVYTRHRRDFDGMVTSDGDVLNLTDPAIGAFLDLIPFRSNERHTFSTIGTVMSRMPACERRSFHQFGLIQKKIETLARLRAGGGWAKLDALFMIGVERAFTSFVDSVDLHYEPSDLGLGGETCFRIGLYCPIEADRHMLTIDWFAAASSPDHLIPLMQQVMDGAFPIGLRKYPSHQVEISQLAVFLDEKELINVPVARTPGPSDAVKYCNSLDADWSKCVISSDSLTLFKALETVVPSDDRGRLKAQFLENSLGF